jgi:hypothetical protein
MNRREFQRCLILLAGAGAVGFARANKVVDGITQRPYRYRFRYVRKSNNFWIWMRVRDYGQSNRSLPVSLVFSTDPNMAKPVLRRTYLTSAVLSHIVRDEITVDPSLWIPGSPLYAMLRIDESATPSRIWRLSKA